MTAWLALVPNILCMLVAVAAPGALVLLAGGACRLRSFLGAPLVSFALLGLLSLASAWVGWGVGLIVAGTCAACLLVAAFRVALNRRGIGVSFRDQGLALRSPAGGSARGSRAMPWLLAGVLVSAVAAFAMVGSSVADPDRFLQNYDAAFHLSVVRHILETGCASPIGAGSVMGSETAVYPSLWHALVALNASTFSMGIASSSWVVVLTLLMFVAPSSICLLTSTLLEPRHGFSFLFAATVPLFIASSITEFSLFGPLYANLSGMSVLPAAVSYSVMAFDGAPSTPKPLSVSLTLLLCLLGLGFAHPNTVFTLTLFLLPLCIARSGSAPRRVAVGAAFAACWAACMNLPFFARTVNCLDRVGEDVVKGTGAASRMGLDYDSLASFDWVTLVPSAIVVLAGVALAFALRRRWGNSWCLVTISLLGAQVVCSLFPMNWFSVIATGFWYRDYFRVLYAFRLFSSILLCIVPELAFDWAGRASLGLAGGRAGAVLRKALQALVMCACVVVSLYFMRNGVLGYQSQLRVQSGDVETFDDITMLSEERADFLGEVAAEVGDSVVLNNHNDASVWLYPIYDVRALAKGRTGNQMSAMDDDYYTLVRSIDQYGANTSEGDAVRDAAAALHVEYLVQLGLAPDSSTTFKSDGTIDYQLWDAANNVSESTPGFTLVLERDGMRLWKLDEVR